MPQASRTWRRASRPASAATSSAIRSAGSPSWVSSSARSRKRCAPCSSQYGCAGKLGALAVLRPVGDRRGGGEGGRVGGGAAPARAPISRTLGGRLTSRPAAYILPLSNRSLPSEETMPGTRPGAGAVWRTAVIAVVTLLTESLATSDPGGASHVHSDRITRSSPARGRDAAGLVLLALAAAARAPRARHRLRDHRGADHERLLARHQPGARTALSWWHVDGYLSPPPTSNRSPAG